MHVEMYVDTADLPELEADVAALPRVSIDHLGMSSDGWDSLLRLVDAGVRVKATGFGRVAHDVASALQDIHAANPAALMFGTDLPGTRAPRPFGPEDIELIETVLGAGALPAVLHDNAAEFYRIR